MAVLLFVLLVLCAGLSFGDTPYRWDVCLNGLWDIAYGNDRQVRRPIVLARVKVPSSWNVTTTWAIHRGARRRRSHGIGCALTFRLRGVESRQLMFGCSIVQSVR